MNRIVTSRTGGTFVTLAFCHASRTRLLCAEYPDDPNIDVRAVARVTAASADAASQDEHWADAVCGALALHLSNADRVRDRMPNMVFACAVEIASKQADVCVAGDVRAHLFANGEPHEVTPDHINRVEPLEHWPADSVIYHPTAPTRWLGAGSPRPRQSYTWTISSDSMLLICPSSAHRYREPRSYLANWTALSAYAHVSCAS